MTTMTLVLIAGLLPVAVLMFYIYSHDKIEKEPTGLLVKLFFFGCLSTIPAVILELLGVYFLVLVGLDSQSVFFIFLENFLVVALAEEGCKKLLLRLGSWNNPAFNYIFDGIVYGVCVTLGFAALENILYIVGDQLDLQVMMSIALVRGIAAIPLHCICGVFMGHFYGLEKTYAVRGMRVEADNAKAMSLLIPVLIHGFYDFAASMQSSAFTVIWLVFVIVMDVIAIRSIKKYSREDTPI